MRDFFLKAYTQHKSNAKTRGIEFRLTFDEWKQIWVDSGYWNQRGRGADKYCMCRIGDVGCYEMGNVFIGLGKFNVRDGNLGKLDSEETKQKKSKALAGKPHPWSLGDKNPMHRPEVKAKISAAIGGANHYKARGVNTPQGYFVTAKAASEALNIPKPTIEWRARNNKFGFSLPAIA
jgi:hypothetical protein